MDRSLLVPSTLDTVPISKGPILRPWRATAHVWNIWWRRMLGISPISRISSLRMLVRSPYGWRTVRCYSGSAA